MNASFNIRSGLGLVAAALIASCATTTTPSEDTSVPGMANCTCYYSYHAECKDEDGQEMVCTEDWKPKNCIRREPKGGADFGKCTRTVPGQPQIAGCDGTCAPKKNGSACGGFDVAALTAGLSLWRDAINRAATSDRPDIGPEVAEQMMQLPLNEECRFFVGRTALAVMELCRSEMVTHPGHEHETFEHPIANLSGNSCQINAGNLCFDALLAAFERPDAVPEITARIPEVCPDELPFAAPCTNDFECVNRAVRISAEVMQIERPMSLAERLRQ